MIKNIKLLIGMLLLLSVAFFLPQMVFSIGDKFRLSNSETDARGSLDITQLNLSYEEDLNTRLKKYFYLNNPTVTAIEQNFTRDSELSDMLNDIFKQDWTALLFYYNKFESNFYMEDFVEEAPVYVQNCKKYIVHGADYQDGVALMMLYFDLQISSTRVRLLVDADSQTIYYIRVTEKEDEVDWSYAKYQKEALYYQVDSLWNNIYFYYDYYEADKFDSEDEYDSYVESLSSFETMMEEDRCEVIFRLPFGELDVDFIYRTEFDDNIGYDFVMGIDAIGKIIPEMIQD